MAIISKSGIGTGNTIQAEHITRIIDALNGTGSADIIATGSFTGSFNGSADIWTVQDLTVFGTASINYFETIYETSSIIYQSGSTKFGNSADDTHQFTGSVFIDGDTQILGNTTATGSFSGSFVGDGSGLDGVVATTLFALSEGSGISAFTFDGSSTQTINISGSVGLTTDTVTKWTGAAFADTSITDNGAVVDINSDTVITGSVNIRTTGDPFESWKVTLTDFGYDTEIAARVDYIGNDVGFTVSSGSDAYHMISYVPDGDRYLYIAEGLITIFDSGSNSANKYIQLKSPTNITGSLDVTGGITGSFTGSFVGDSTGSFTGSFVGDGAGLYNIPASGIVGLNLSQIASGSVTASISPVNGMQINTDTTVTGSLIVTEGITGSFTGSFVGDGVGLYDIPASGITGLNLSQIASGSATASIAPNTGFRVNTDSAFTGSMTISGSASPALSVIGSGSAVFTVNGSVGEIFSVSDSLSGSLFAVNDASGFPIFEVFSDETINYGSNLAPALTTTVKNTVSSAGVFTVYSLPTASYDGAWFEYVAKSGSDARAGQIMSLWSGTAVNFTETTTTDFGDTSGLSFTVAVSGSNFALTGSVATAGWTIKTIVRSI